MQEAPHSIRAPIAAFLSWILPGLGHFYLGQGARGLVFLVTVTATFWTGVAVGGVRSTVDPQQRRLWFVAQMCSGGNALGAFALHRSVADSSESPGSNLSSEVGVHYTGVAGLLNLLVILDAIGRAENLSAPTIRRELSESP